MTLCVARGAFGCCQSVLYSQSRASYFLSSCDRSEPQCSYGFGIVHKLQNSKILAMGSAVGCKLSMSQCHCNRGLAFFLLDVVKLMIQVLLNGTYNACTGICKMKTAFRIVVVSVCLQITDVIFTHSIMSLQRE